MSGPIDSIERPHDRNSSHQDRLRIAREATTIHERAKDFTRGCFDGSQVHKDKEKREETQNVENQYESLEAGEDSAKDRGKQDRDRDNRIKDQYSVPNLRDVRRVVQDCEQLDDRRRDPNRGSGCCLPCYGCDPPGEVGEKVGKAWRGENCYPSVALA